MDCIPVWLNESSVQINCTPFISKMRTMREKSETISSQIDGCLAFIRELISIGLYETSTTEMLKRWRNSFFLRSFTISLITIFCCLHEISFAEINSEHLLDEKAIACAGIRKKHCLVKSSVMIISFFARRCREFTMQIPHWMRVKLWSYLESKYDFSTPDNLHSTRWIGFCDSSRCY